MTPSGYPTQSGISLYTLLAAVVVLGVLTSVLVTSYNGDNTKAQALGVLMKNIGDAANRYHLDTSCYPATIKALMVYTTSQDSNSCGATIPESQWHGPYVKKHELAGESHFSMPGYKYDLFKPGTRLYLTDGVNDHNIRGQVSGLKEGAHGVFVAPQTDRDIAKKIVKQLGPGFVRRDRDGPQDTITYIYASD